MAENAVSQLVGDESFNQMIWHAPQLGRAKIEASLAGVDSVGANPRSVVHKIMEQKKVRTTLLGR
jgi:hypothetical protein